MVERLVSVKVLASVGMVPSGHSSPQSARRRGWLVRSRSISRNANNGQLGLGRDLRQTEQQCPELAPLRHADPSDECQLSVDVFSALPVDFPPAGSELPLRSIRKAADGTNTRTETYPIAGSHALCGIQRPRKSHRARIPRRAIAGALAQEHPRP